MRIICIVGGDVNCQKHVGGSGEDPCTALPGGGGGQRILFQVSHQDRGRGVPPPPRQPYPHGGDSPWIPCPGVHLQHQGETYLARPSGLSPITARPLRGREEALMSGREVGVFSIQGRKCLCDTMRQGRFSMDALLCRYLYWYQHNSITEIHHRDPVSAPRPRGGEREPLLYVELLNRGAPGAEHLPQCSGR